MTFVCQHVMHPQGMFILDQACVPGGSQWLHEHKNCVVQGVNMLSISLTRFKCFNCTVLCPVCFNFFTKRTCCELIISKSCPKWYSLECHDGVLKHFQFYKQLANGLYWFHEKTVMRVSKIVFSPKCTCTYTCMYDKKKKM